MAINIGPQAIKKSWSKRLLLLLEWVKNLIAIKIINMTKKDITTVMINFTIVTTIVCSSFHFYCEKIFI